jgi:type 1 glutamine amidotransferase
MVCALKRSGRWAAILFAVSSLAIAQDPQLRIFIRSSEKTHGSGNGLHDYPEFLARWTKLLTEHGAAVAGAPRFPTAAELEKTDVLIDYSSDGANLTADDKVVLNDYLRRGGGIVVIHDGMCGNESEWFAGVVGGSKQHGERNSHAGSMKLHFEDTSHPITRGVADFDFDDEMFFLLRTDPGMHVLATTADPAGKTVPQLWTFEKTLPGGKPYRAFVSLQGHKITNFEFPAYRTLLLRGIAWAGNRPAGALIASK